MFNMLRILRGSPGRVHTMPQADLVASICIGMVNASAVLSCFSTYAAPSTRLRNFRPCSNSLSLIEVPLESPRAATRSEASAVRFERGGRPATRGGASRRLGARAGGVSPREAGPNGSFSGRREAVPGGGVVQGEVRGGGNAGGRRPLAEGRPGGAGRAVGGAPRLQPP